MKPVRDSPENARYPKSVVHGYLNFYGGWFSTPFDFLCRSFSQRPRLAGQSMVVSSVYKGTQYFDTPIPNQGFYSSLTNRLGASRSPRARHTNRPNLFTVCLACHVARTCPTWPRRDYLRRNNAQRTDGSIKDYSIRTRGSCDCAICKLVIQLWLLQIRSAAGSFQWQL